MPQVFDLWSCILLFLATRWACNKGWWRKIWGTRSSVSATSYKCWRAR